MPTKEKQKMNGNEGTKNNSHVKAAYIVTAICLITAGILFYFLFTAIFADWRFKGNSGQGTRLEFNTDNSEEAGFNREMTIYTEDGITKAVFSGKITVDGTSEIIVAANEDGRIVYCGTYSDLKDESIKLEINDLEPYTYYTISFCSDNANKGHLLLTSNDSLAKRPETPEHPDHTAPARN